MVIVRDFNRTENDDFKLRVISHLSQTQEAVPLRTKEGDLVGWRIQDKYE